MIAWLRSAVFYFGLIPLTILFCLLAIVLRPIPHTPRFKVVSRWNVIALWWLRVCCGVTWRVTGLEKLPRTPAVAICKHQSAWETIALPAYLPAHAWVLKKELLWVPFFGWALAALEPIAIDRSLGASAIKQVLSQGEARLRANTWVVIFPEGTRVSTGQKRPYARSAASLALRVNCPIVPISHNAGLYWPKDSFVKRSGHIDLVIGDPILPGALTAAELTARCEDWIEAEARCLMAKAAPARSCARSA